MIWFDPKDKHIQVINVTHINLCASLAIRECTREKDWSFIRRKHRKECERETAGRQTRAMKEKLQQENHQSASRITARRRITSQTGEEPGS